VNRIELQNATLKLQRAVASGGIDPVSGFSAQEIAEWIAENAPFELQDKELVASCRAILRKYGFSKLAEEV